MSNHTKGVLLIVASTFFLSINTAMVKLLEFSVYEKIFFRNIIGVLIIGVLLKPHQIKIPKSDRKLLFFRVLFGLIALVAFYYAIDNMALSDAVMLNKLNSFFVIIFAAMFLHERLHKVQILSIVVAFIGALFVIKPSFDSSMLIAMIALLSAVLSGGAYTIVRKIKHMNPLVIVFYFTLFNAVMGLALSTSSFVVPDRSDWLPIVAMGLGATLGQVSLTTAYRFAPASELSIFNYMNIVFTIIFAFVLFGTIPDMYSILGGLLIFGAGYLQYYVMNKVPKTIEN